METQNPPIMPRNVQFEFVPDLPTNWHSDNPAISHFYDALSLTFLSGERFFIDSVRHFEHEITDPALQRDIKGFYAQEATHAREHASYFSYLRPGFHPDKRRVDPKILEWRAHYRATHKRQTHMHPTLFGES